ncbi:hypothetical protein DVH05_015761 [Phytophthora capsici]|nr:hypothetical protein DVH05_015761 [Phytophthora capsici]
MVRRATLQVNGYVFLLPEHVEGLAEYPFYAKVSALTAEKATVRSLDLDDPVTCEIDIDIARNVNGHEGRGDPYTCAPAHASSSMDRISLPLLARAGRWNGRSPRTSSTGRSSRPR